jgi:branched-chain amino acid transport system ATP-binding protein
MLRLRDVTAGYGKARVLDSVSLNVEQGAIVTLLGSNGAAKSTVMKVVSGLLRPWSGSVTLRGEEIGGLQPPAIVARGLCMVPEGREVFAHLTVRENLRMGAYTRKDDRAVRRDLEWIFSLFPILEDRSRQKGGTLSGGEQQMLAIARALMGRPEILLLDEPSLGLAPLLVREIFGVIRQIHGDGTTVLLVEQNANMALKIADYAYMMETGRITGEGKPEALLADRNVCKAYLGR